MVIPTKETQSKQLLYPLGKQQGTASQLTVNDEQRIFGRDKSVRGL